MNFKKLWKVCSLIGLKVQKIFIKKIWKKRKTRKENLNKMIFNVFLFFILIMFSVMLAIQFNIIKKRFVETNKWIINQQNGSSKRICFKDGKV